MFVLFGRGKYLGNSDGSVYVFANTKEAARIVDVCYGYSAFKNGLLKIKRIDNMGIHSTVAITKDEAMELIESGLKGADKDALGQILFTLYGDKLRMNFRVIDKYAITQSIRWEDVKDQVEL